MKLTFTYIAIALSVWLNAQEIPNAGFENWSEQTLWSDPVPFQTLNLSAYSGYGSASAIQTNAAHGGSSAVFLQAQGIVGNAVEGALSLGQPGTSGFDNPIPFNGRPDSLSFWANYYMDNGDQGTVVVMLLKDGVQVGNTLITLTGSTEDYTRFSSAVTYITADEPNQLGFAAFSTMQAQSNPASYIYLDDVSFIYNNEAGDQIPGGDFEQWTPFGITNPDGWFTSNIFTEPNSSVTASSDAYAGLSARIESYPVIFGSDENFGFVILDDLFNEECGAGEIATFGITIPYMVSGYYKYTPVKASDDSASVYFAYSLDDFQFGCEIIYEHVFLLPPAEVWTPFSVELPFSAYNEWCFSDLTPQFFSLGFASTIIDLGDGPTGLAGGVLYLDELTMQSDICWSIAENDAEQIHLYPNPVNDFLNLVYTGSSNFTLQIMDSQGRLVLNQPNTPATSKIEISNLTSGSYTMRVIDETQVVCKSFVKM